MEIFKTAKKFNIILKLAKINLIVEEQQKYTLVQKKPTFYVIL